MTPDFNKNQDQLIPTIIQDAASKNVLMLGYMNPEAWQQTQEKGLVTFYSRSKKRLWTKGETSGNFLEVVASEIDCDNDTILLHVLPKGPTCHKGMYSCFAKTIEADGQFQRLQFRINQRSSSLTTSESYTKQLLESDISRIAQKVGEEAVEVVIATLKNDRVELLNESADLLYHLSVLWQKTGVTLREVEQVLWERDQNK